MEPIKEQDPQPEFVYVMAADAGAVKIGYTRTPEKRLREIRSGWVPDSVDHAELEIVYLIDGSRDLERELHAHFRQQRVTGEWFNLGPPPMAVMHVSDVVRRYAIRTGMTEPVPHSPPPKPAFVPARDAYLDDAAAWTQTARQPSIERAESGPDAPPRFAAVAAQHREFFQAWIAAGFTEGQALQLVVALIARDGS